MHGVKWSHIIPSTALPTFNLSRGLISQEKSKHLCGCVGHINLHKLVWLIFGILSSYKVDCVCPLFGAWQVVYSRFIRAILRKQLPVAGKNEVDDSWESESKLVK